MWRHHLHAAFSRHPGGIKQNRENAHFQIWCHYLDYRVLREWICKQRWENILAAYFFSLPPAQLSATCDIFTSSLRRRGPPGLTAAVPPMTSEWYLVQLGLHLSSPGLPLQPQLDHFHPNRAQTHMCCSRPSIRPTNTGLFILEWATVFCTLLPHVWLWNKW